MQLLQPVNKCAVSVLSLTALLTMPLSLALCSPSAQAADNQKSKSSKVKKSSSASNKAVSGDESANIKASLSGFGSALARGDEKAVAQMWTLDGTYTSAEGAAYKGREAIQKRFGDVIDQNGPPTVDMVVDGLRFLGTDVAIVDGTVHRRGVPVQFSAETRFALVLQKQKGGWLISSAIETPLDVKTQDNPLGPLEFLVGDWSAQGPQASLLMKAEWTANKNFLTLTYLAKKADGTIVPESKQVIGWDPRAEKPISWNFDSSGGFGWGHWHKNGDKWVVSASGVTRDGSQTLATNVISVTDKDTFSWQSTGRSVDGEPLSDTAPVSVRRVSK